MRHRPSKFANKQQGQSDKITQLRQSLSDQGITFSKPASTLKAETTNPGTNIWPDNFPAQLLQKPVLHEIIPTRFADTSPTGFSLMAISDITAQTDISTITQPAFLWCSTTNQTCETGALFAPGLKHFGLNPDLFIQLKTQNTNDILWAMEEAARKGVFKIVIGFIDRLSFTQSRRLSLVAASGRTTIFIIRPPNFTGSTTAFCRWKTSSQPALQNVFNPRAPGTPTFKLQLVQSRTGHKGKWICHYEHQAHDMSVVAATGHRTEHLQHPANQFRPRQIVG